MRLAEYERCKDIPHLEAFFQDVIDKGGEGIILRDPNSPYKPGLSTGYLKHKVISKQHFAVILNHFFM
jgi:DNA ligase 1